MKNRTNLFFWASLLVAVLAPDFTQAQGDLFAFGIKGGVNLARFRGDQYNFSSGQAFLRSVNKDQVGAIGGVFFRFGSKFFVQPEAVLSQKGGKFQILRDNQGVNDPRDLDVRFTNLDVPVLVGIRIGEVLRLNLGPVASLRLSDNGNLKDTFNQYSGQSVDQVFRQAVLGYQAGIGLDFGKLNFDVRYEGNLTDAVRVQFNNATTQAQFNRKLNLWQATLGFEIF
jgi:hypothetical protein